MVSIIIGSLRTEFYANPTGLGTTLPRLSWKLSEGDGVEQEAYQILAGFSEEPANNVFFDTGRKEGSECVFVSWPGPEIPEGTKVYWKVRAWVRGSAEPTPWSDVASMETAIQGRWKGKWIGFGDAGKDRSPPVPFLRKSFSLSAAPEWARLRVAVLGLCELEINGKPVHPKKALIPGWSDFRKRAQVMSFDVSTLLMRGENMLGCMLGDGWYAGYLGFANTRQIYGGSPALLVQLDVRLPGGRKLTIASDETWEGRTGPILSSDLYHGEIYDARGEIPGWSLPGASRRGWQPVERRRWPRGLILDAKVSEPVERIEEVPAHSVSEPIPGAYIFDLGQNIVGWARLRLRGKKGQTVRLRFGEMLNPDGTLYTANLRSARATDRYTFGDDGICEWEPRFTFHGFRYVELTGCDAKPSRSAITGVILHNAMRETGGFSCSDPRVNRLASNIRWGLKGNFLEVPTDCPQRDERLGWTGDIQVFVKTACFFYDVDAFLTKWMRDLRDGQTEDGAFPDIAPTFICGFGNAAWADAGVIVPWVVYRRFGDKRILEENYEAMSRWIDYQEKTSRNLVRPPTTYGDWLAVDAVIPEHAPVPSDFVGTAYFARTTGIMAEVASLLGRREDARRFRQLRDRVVKAFQREFMTPTGRLVGDCQTAYLLALAFDLLPVAMRSVAVERLVALIHARNWHLSTGFVGTPLLCPVLSRFGRHDVAMKLLLQDTYPSWLFTVKNGATTMWERWNSYTPDKGFGDVAMNSFNHYAYGAIGEWMVHYVAGVAPGHEEPAYRHILFRPQKCEGLTRASATLETPYGLTTIEWEEKGGHLEGRLCVPSNTYADFEHASSGRLVRGGEAISFEGVGKVRLSSGDYQFRVASDRRG